jgi:hypothetical protein
MMDGGKEKGEMKWRKGAREGGSEDKMEEGG